MLVVGTLLGVGLLFGVCVWKIRKIHDNFRTGAAGPVNWGPEGRKAIAKLSLLYFTVVWLIPYYVAQARSPSRAPTQDPEPIVSPTSAPPAFNPEQADEEEMQEDETKARRSLKIKEFKSKLQGLRRYARPMSEALIKAGKSLAKLKDAEVDPFDQHG